MSTTHVTARRPDVSRPTGGLVWFAAMVSGWLTFCGLLFFSEQSLSDLWHWIRALPLLVEGLVWLVAFPFVFALGIWDSTWETWLRLLLVGGCAVGWSLAFWPRKEQHHA